MQWLSSVDTDAHSTRFARFRRSRDECVTESVKVRSAMRARWSADTRARNASPSPSSYARGARWHRSNRSVKRQKAGAHGRKPVTTPKSSPGGPYARTSPQALSRPQGKDWKQSRAAAALGFPVDLSAGADRLDQKSPSVPRVQNTPAAYPKLPDVRKSRKLLRSLQIWICGRG